MRIARHRQPPPWKLELAARGRATLHLLIAGTFELRGRGIEARPAGAGDIVLVGSGSEPVVLRSTGMQRCDVISASYEGASEVPPVAHLASPEVRRAPALATLARLFTSALDDPSTLRLASTLLEPLLAYALDAGRTRAPRPQHRDRRVARALEAMDATLAERWTVERLAKVARLSRAAFARRFVAEVGVPPLRHLAASRMRRAAELLAESDDSLASIAAQVGYESEFAFSRAFKRHHGVAPGVFRRRGGSMAPVLRAAA